MISKYGTMKLFLMNWTCEKHDNVLYAEGIKQIGDRISYSSVLTNYKTSLFVWTPFSYKTICETLEGMNIVFNYGHFTVRQHSVLDVTNSSNNSFLNRMTKTEDHNYYSCYRIETKCFWDTIRLYKIFSQCEHLLKTINILSEWSFDIMISLFTYPHENYMTWCVKDPTCGDIKFLSKEKPLEPVIISFDIETLSYTDDRVPTGEFKDDILFSISAEIKNPNEDQSKIYIYCHLPTTSNQSIPSEIIEEHIMKHKKNNNSCTSMENYYIRFFKNEIDMMVDFMKLMLEFKDQYTILLGYNSINYDMMFLLKRFVYHNRSDYAEMFFVTDKVITFTKSMYHVDMYRFIAKFHRFNTDLKDFKLNTVASLFLKKKKVDVDINEFRHIYMSILNGDKPDLDRIAYVLYYNSVDTTLLTELWYTQNMYKFLFDNSKAYNIKIQKIPVSESCDYLRCKTIIDCIKFKTVISFNSADQIIYGKDFFIRFNIKNEMNRVWKRTPTVAVKRKRANSTDSEEDAEEDVVEIEDEDEDFVKQAKYKGGMNYCFGKSLVNSVMATDYTAYYPYLIEGFNVSFETSIIVPAGIMVDKFRELFIESIREYGLSVFYYNNHENILTVNRPINDGNLLRLIEEYMYIKGDLSNSRDLINADGILEIKDMSTPLVILSKTHKGILYKMIERQNCVRDLSKNNLKSIKATLEILNDCIDKKKYASESEQSTDDNDDEDEEENRRKSGSGALLKDIREYVKIDSLYEDFEINSVTNTVKLISEKDMNKFELDQLYVYEKLLQSDEINITSQYRLLKIINNGIYGRLGASFGSLSALHIAAIVTMLGRKFIFETSNIGRMMGFETLLIDTDSVFLYNIKKTHHIENVVSTMRSINNKLVLNYKVYNTVMTIAKKTYIYKTEDALSSKGIMKNVSPLLFEIYKSLYAELIEKGMSDTETRDIVKIMEGVYEKLYCQVAKDKSLVVFQMNIKKDYKTETPVKKLMDRIKMENPYFVFQKTISYFYRQKNSVKTVHIDLAEKLDSTRLTDINMYKFLNRINKMLYNIVSVYMYTSLRKNENINYVMSYKEFDNININAYIKCRDAFLISEMC